MNDINPTASAWPGEPGVPLNPDQDGWHVLTTRAGATVCKEWQGGHWLDAAGHPRAGSSLVCLVYGYQSPVRTSADIATTAREHEAAAEARVIAMREADVDAWTEILDVRTKRMEALHDLVLSAREIVRSRLHPKSPPTERELFDKLQAAHYTIGGDPTDVNARAVLATMRKLPLPPTDALAKVAAEAKARDRNDPIWRGFVKAKVAEAEERGRKEATENACRVIHEARMRTSSAPYVINEYAALEAAIRASAARTDGGAG